MAATRRPLLAATVVLAAVVAGAGLPRSASAADPRDREIAALRTEIARLSDGQRSLSADIESSESLLAAQRRRLEQGFDRLAGLHASLEDQAVRVAGLETTDRRDTLREDVLRPVFQVVGDEAVGSGVLVHRGRDEEGAYYLALSCHHVLRDILAEVPDVDPADYRFQLRFDQLGDQAVEARARLLHEDEQLDLALLRIDTDEDLGPVARLAPLRRCDDVRPFTPVYTVGCPLGTGAQATLGEVTRDDWKVLGQPYWMVSSPAYFGNSGGGVFLEETHELIGIFSKIYTHGSYRPQVVTHMGLAVPLESIHSWLTGIGYAELLPQPRDDAANDAQVEEAAASPAENH